MQQRPPAVEGGGKECGVLILGGHQDTPTLPVDEVPGRGEKHQWAREGEAHVHDEVLVPNLCDPRVFDPPVLLEAVDLRAKSPHQVELPSGQPVLAHRHGE